MMQEQKGLFIKYFWRKLELEAKSLLESEMLVARFYSPKNSPRQAAAESSPVDNRRCQICHHTGWEENQ